MKRRDFLAGAISAAAVSHVSAQTSGASRRLAICSLGESSSLMRERSDNRYYGVLFEELRRLGHVEGKNLVVGRYGKEQATSGPAALAAEVVRSAPDVIYIVGPGTAFFMRETGKIPIVALTADPVAQGLITNMARPGGNLTGVTIDTGPAIHGKRLALLRDASGDVKTGLSCRTRSVGRHHGPCLAGRVGAGGHSSCHCTGRISDQ
jgi:putative ABC transport system substrate-binding protein